MSGSVRKLGWITPLRVAALYIVLGALWVLFSDEWLSSLVQDVSLLTLFQTLKEWLFVTGTGFFLYLFTSFLLSHMAQQQPADTHPAGHPALHPVPPTRKRILSIGFILLALLLIANAIVSIRTTLDLIEDREALARTQEVLLELEAAMAAVTNAETGQRGYLLTKQDVYLDTYYQGTAVIGAHLQRLKKLTSDNPLQLQLLSALDSTVSNRLHVLREVLSTLRRDGFEVAQEMVRQGEGYREMEEIRTIVNRAKQEEYRLFAIRAASVSTSTHRTIFAFGIASVVAFTCLVIVYYLHNRDLRNRRRGEDHIRTLNEQLEHRVRERTAQLGDANKELESFSHSISHDLRAPLRAIDSFSSILREEHSGSLDPEGRRVLDTIITNAKQMGLLIDDLLTFSRISKKGIIKSTIDMTRMAREVAEETLQENPEHPMKVVVHDLPPACGDPSMIRQIFVNLIGNAHKFTRGRCEPSVEVGAHLGNGELQYYVRDNGVGFDMRYADKLFGVFQRLHSAAEFEGTGVGLAIVQRIVHRHNGRVWAEAVPDQGATFLFSLPADEGGIMNDVSAAEILPVEENPHDAEQALDTPGS